jgi:hypothetical protein
MKGHNMGKQVITQTLEPQTSEIEINAVIA